MPEVAPMLIVCTEQPLVEAELVGGRLGCPSCRGALEPWRHGRERVLRCSAGDRLLRAPPCAARQGARCCFPPWTLSGGGSANVALSCSGRDRALGLMNELLGSWQDVGLWWRIARA
jgi:hypothetical protein